MCACLDRIRANHNSRGMIDNIECTIEATGSPSSTVSTSEHVRPRLERDGDVIPRHVSPLLIGAYSRTRLRRLQVDFYVVLWGSSI